MRKDVIVTGEKWLTIILIAVTLNPQTIMSTNNKMYSKKLFI